MIDYSLITLIPSEELHREFSYQVKKAAEGEYIAQIWGWDENSQRNFHTEVWQQNRPDIITYENKPIGTIFIIENEDYIEIRQFFLLPEYQRQGIGSYILKRILDKADISGRITRLAYLKNNPVVSLYERHGFQISDVIENFYFMERKPGDRTNIRE